MAEPSVIIIGAGLAGLSTGCYARMNGYSAHIFERHSKPGGVVAAWKRKDYLIDGGIHFIWGHKPGNSMYELYNELGILKNNRLFDLKAVRYSDEASGRTLDIIGDLDRLSDELKSLSSVDGDAIDALIAGARAMRDIGVASAGLDTPHELTGALGRFKQMWRMRRVLRYFGGAYSAPVAEYAGNLSDPWLRFIINNLFLPEVPVWFALMNLGLLAGGHIGVIEDGSRGLVRSIEDRYTGLGGQVTYRAPISKILVKNDRAVGVRLEDGSEHYADTIVSAADGHSTIFDLLGGGYVDDEIKNRYRNWKLFRPLVMVSFGVARDFAGEPYMNLIALKRQLLVGGRPTDGMMLRLFNHGAAYSPPGKTVIQAELETEWEYWSGLRARDRARYDGEKTGVATAVLERLEARYPGISSQVEVTDVATPYTTWRYTRNYRGAFEGWLPTSEAIMARVKKTLPGLKNFYMAGQWVMPGGGVPPSLFSGRHVVQILCDRDRRPFAAVSP